MPRRSQRLASKANDPITKLPDLCIDMVFSYFTPTEMIGVQRVSKAWRDAVNWRFSREVYWKRWIQNGFLTTDDGVVRHPRWEDAAVAFRRAVYRYEARKSGTPTFIRRFTNAYVGWCVCGDYFVWADHEAINIQRVFDAENPRNMCGPIRRIMCGRNSGGRSNIVGLYPQRTGAGGPPLLAMVSELRPEISPFIRYGSRRISLIDVARRKVLWTFSEREGNPFSLSFNHKTLVYAHIRLVNNDNPIAYRNELALQVLDIRTGKKIASARIRSSTPIGNPKVIVRCIRAHPRQELVFIALEVSQTHRYEVLVYCTKTLGWVGRLKLPIVSTAGAAVSRPSYFNPDVGTWDINFNDFGPTSVGGREVISFSSPQSFNDGSHRIWVIHKFVLPTDEELASEYSRGDSEEEEESNNKSTAKTVPALKWIKSWRREPMEVVFCEDDPNSSNRWLPLDCINPDSKQIGDLRSSVGPRKVIIHSAEEVDKVPFLEPLKLLIAPEGPGEVGHPDPIKIKLFAPSSRSEITKPKKSMPKNTPWEQMRAPFDLPPNKRPIWEVLSLKERYMIIGQGSDKYYMSFAPAW